MLRGLAGAAGLACLLLLGLAPGASAGIGCRYVSAGPEGPKGNRLEIKLTRFEEVVALLPGKGQSIQVTDDQRMKPIKCSGGNPTMVNLDQVNLTVERKARDSSIYIAQAPKFGPGATPPEEGGRGITFIAKGYSLSFGIGGTEESDLIRMGMSGKAVALDFHQDGEFGSALKSDIDAKIYGKKFVGLLVRGGAGYDNILASQYGLNNSPFDNQLTVPTSIYGEEGRDSLWGGKKMDYIDGGPGGDFMLGGAGADEMVGGPGIDFMDSGGGRDEIDAIDRIPGEQINCGPGKDLVRMDLKDQDKNCETFRFP